MSIHSDDVLLDKIEDNIESSIAYHVKCSLLIVDNPL